MFFVEQPKGEALQDQGQVDQAQQGKVLLGGFQTFNIWISSFSLWETSSEKWLALLPTRGELRNYSGKSWTVIFSVVVLHFLLS